MGLRGIIASRGGVNPFGDSVSFAANASNFFPNLPNFVAKTLNVVASAPYFVANASTLLNTTPKPSQISPKKHSKKITPCHHQETLLGGISSLWPHPWF